MKKFFYLPARDDDHTFRKRFSFISLRGIHAIEKG